ncbi:M48 family metalloprotease [Longispora sp. NPDC051575]|uniref:M48 family metalloprotease n=1 Tax=Longispora sp. NPDC051575 TaxID=3154943 RepID=UPI00343E8AFA
MTVAAAPDGGRYPAVDWDRVAGVERPRQLWWVYALVAAALVALGGGAAQALYYAHDLGGMTAAQDCLSDRGLSLTATAADRNLATSRQIAECAGTLNFRQGVAMIVGSVGTVAVVWLLMVGGGLVTRARLRRGRTPLAATDAARAAADRFDRWCDVWRLTGRRRPRLLLTAPGSLSGQAFATGLPFARPWVAVPASYAYAEPGQFDLVVLHELAHVRARDLLWTSAVWWSGWLGVPLLLAVLGPFLTRPDTLRLLFGRSLVLAAVLSVVVLVLRVALLRRRELLADAYAVRVLGGRSELRAAFGLDPDGVPAPVRGSGGTGFLARAGAVGVRARGLAATHPPPAVRADPPPGAVEGSEGGFAVAALAGLVAMFAFQHTIVVLSDVLNRVPHDARVPSDVGLGLAALLWAGVLVPAWVRRARGGSRSWWGPVLGSVAGVAGGYAAQIPGGVPVSDSQFGDDLAFSCLVLAAVTLGVTVLAVCLAVGVSAGRRRAATVLAVVTAALAGTATWSVTFTVLSIHIVNRSAAQDRTLVSSMGGHYGGWRYLAPVLVVCLGLTALAARAPGRRIEPPLERGPLLARIRADRHLRRLAPVALPAIVVGGLGGGVSWVLRFRPEVSGDLVNLLVHQRWWACALAGWAVTAVLLLTHADRAPTMEPDRRPAATGAGFPGALAAGFGTAALAGVVTFLSAATSGFGWNLSTLSYSVEMPLWLLFVTTVATLPAVFLTTGAIRRRRVAPWRTATVALGTTALVGTLVAALFWGALAAVAIGPHDWSLNDAVVNRPVAPTRPPAALPSPVGPGPAPGGTADPGRSLDDRAAVAVVAGVTPLLPAGYRESVPDAHPGLTETEPARCGELFAADAAAENALPRTGQAVRRYDFTPEPNIAMNVTVRVISFRTPRPDLGTIRGEVARCPSFAWPYDGADDRLLHGTLADGADLALPYPSYRYHQVVQGTAGGRLTRTTSTEAHVLVGRNQIVVGVTYTYTGRPPSAAVPRYAGQLLATAPAALIERLRAQR